MLVRVLAGVAWLIGGLLALGLGLYLLACHTAWGREGVRLLAIAQLEPVLAGQIGVAEISRLGASGISLHGLQVREPSGSSVLELELLELDWSPFALLSGELDVARLRLGSGRIDLGDLSTRRGLLAAFSPKSVAPEHPAEGRPLGIRLTEISVDGLELSAEVAGFGVVTARNLSARASYRQAEHIELALARLSAELLRDGQPLGGIDSASGHYASAGAPSQLTLAGSVARTRVRLDAAGRLPGDPAFEDAPLALSVELGELARDAFAALGYAQWGASLRQPLDVHLAVTGSARAPQGSFSLRAAAGVIEGEAALTAERRVELRVSTRGVSLAELVAGLPAGRLQGTLTGEAALSAPGGVPIALALRDGRYDDIVLPEASARARWSGERLDQLSLELRGYDGSLKLDGAADFSGNVQAKLALELPKLERLPRFPQLELPLQGALELHSDIELAQGKLTARGTLTLRDVLVGNQGSRAPALSLDASTPRPPGPSSSGPAASVARLHSAFDLEGELLAPRVHLTLRATALRAGAVRMDQVVLRLDVRPLLDAWLVALGAEGQLQGEPFQLSVARARIGRDASFDVRGVQASALGQRLTLSGSYGARGMQGLLLEAHGIELGRLHAELGLTPALAGTADLRVTAQGQLQAPVVGLALRGSEVRIGSAPPLSVVAQLELDAGRGRARIETRVADDAGREIALHAQAEFSARPGASWAERLDSARFEADAALEQIDSPALELWLAQPLPVQGTGSLRLWLNGSLREPALQSELRAQLRQLSPGRDAEVLLQASYARGAGRAALIVTDPDGPWLDAELHLAHPEARTQALLRDAAGLLERAAWEARIELQPRRLTALPVALRPPEALSSGELAVQLSASHAPARAPQAQLKLKLRQLERSSVGADCQGAQAELDVSASLDAGHLEGRLALLRRAHPMAELRARSELDLGPLLASGGLPQLAGLELDAILNEVELATLPFLCNRVHGRLSGTAQLRGVLEATPELSLGLRAQGLSLDRLNVLDATLDASVRSSLARLDLALQHGTTRSKLTASVPVSVQGSRVTIPGQQPLTAELLLDHLPLGALVPPGAAISRVSGTLSGRIAVQGTKERAELQGYLEPEAVGFTATALAQPLSEIGGRVSIRKDSIEIERLSARDGDGTLSLTGHLALRAPAHLADARLALVAKDFPLRQQGRVAGTLDASVRVNAALDAEVARVAIQLDEASLWLRGGDLRQGIDLEPHPDLIDPRALSSAARASEPAPANASARPLELSIEARDSIWVRREDFAVKLSAQLTASTKAGQLRITGPVILRRGYLQLLGKVFELQDRSRLEFVGSDPPDPVLDIQAQAKNRGQSKSVTVKITGRAQAPVLEFLVDDQTVSAGEAAETLFASGATTGTAKSQVQSFVSGLSSGVLALSARTELGEMMPILLVEPGTENSASRVRAGFELDSLVPAFLAKFIRGVYVEGIIASGSGEQQQDTGGGVLLELYLPHDLVTSGQYGPGETWSLDLGWEP
ncbi:MAG: translocation/assembly module TamB domain-containing protein [Deltaproteobacteria bacterium]